MSSAAKIDVIQFVKERTRILFYRSYEAHEDKDLVLRTFQQWWQHVENLTAIKIYKSVNCSQEITKIGQTVAP